MSVVTMSNAIGGHERRDALITAAFEAIEDRSTYVLGTTDCIFPSEGHVSRDSWSVASLGEEEDKGQEDDGRDVETPSEIPRFHTYERFRKYAPSEVHRLMPFPKQHRVRNLATQDENRPWKVKALTALSHLTSLERTCFEAERRVCNLQSKYDALILEQSDLEGECDRYRAAWSEAVSRVDAVELELRVLNGRVAMYESILAKEAKEESSQTETIDDVVNGILTRGKEKMATHDEAKQKEDEVKEELRMMEDEYRERLSCLENELAEMEIVCSSHRQHNDSLQDTIRGLEEHLLHAQSRVVQLQEENEYYACYMDDQTRSHEEDVIKDAVWELKQELGEREQELVAMQECLNEEKARSNGLHEQVLRQVMEIEDLRKDASRAKELEQELKALKLVHGETLQDVAHLKLAMKTAAADLQHHDDDDDMYVGRTTAAHHHSTKKGTRGGNPFEIDDESWLM